MMKPIVVKAAVNNVAAIKNLKKNLLFLRKMSILAKFVWFHEKFQKIIFFSGNGNSPKTPDQSFIMNSTNSSHSCNGGLLVRNRSEDFVDQYTEIQKVNSSRQSSQNYKSQSQIRLKISYLKKYKQKIKVPLDNTVTQIVI